MFRGPISKYKNVAPKIVKKEQILTGVSTNRLSNTIGSLINCSLNHITFAIDHAGSGSVCTIRHDDLAKRPTFSNDNQCTTHCHSGQITDIQYNTFNDKIVATCGYDSQIKLWEVQDEGIINLKQVSNLNLNENRSDCVQWNPNVDNVLVSSSLNTIYLWDVETGKNVNALRNHTEAIQSLSWKRDGSMLVTTSKDKTMQIVDPRNNSTSENLLFESGKTTNKDSNVVWVGSSNCILSSNYTMNFQREVHLWDIRNTSEPIHETDIDTGNNALKPYFDYDSSVVYLIGKAETLVRCGEVNLEKNWNFTLNSGQQIEDQIKSACMLPKHGVDLMKCELDRLILLTRNSVYPLPYFVPRRSYYEFHSDAYPESYNTTIPGLDKSAWLDGENKEPVRMTLNPETQNKLINNDKTVSEEKPETPVVSTPVNIASPAAAPVAADPPAEKVSVSTFVSSLNKTAITISSDSKPSESAIPIEKIIPVETVKPTVEEEKPKVLFRPSANTNGANRVSSLRPSPSVAGDRKSRVKSVYYQSKFKYIDGKPQHKTEQISNIRNLSTMWPSECNGFQVNAKNAAFLISGSSGQVGVVRLDNRGRLPDTNISSLVNKSKISDFQWDPFCTDRLAVACDDGIVRIWNIPEAGLDSSKETPDIELKGHLERLYCIKFHPYAKNLIASGSYDRSIKLWNIETQQAVRTLKGPENVIFSMSWSPCGTKLATICKDSVIRIYEPLVSDSPVVEQKCEEGCGPYAGSKAARIEWVSGGARLLISGFERGNQRKIYLYDSENLIFLTLEDINQSPSLMIPYYDMDTNVLYLYAKGEETVLLFEILESEPYFQVLTPYKPDGLHFAISFLPKTCCDVKVAEINRVYRLTKSNCIERISFTVPRVKLGFFQDDIFPDTLDLSSPYQTADEWLSGANIDFKYLSLQPENMEKLTEVLAAQEAKRPPKVVKSSLLREKENNEKKAGTLYNPENLTGDEQKIISSMLQRASLFQKPKSDSESGDDTDWQ